MQSYNSLLRTFKFWLKLKIITFKIYLKKIFSLRLITRIFCNKYSRGTTNEETVSLHAEIKMLYTIQNNDY
jgi:hypothetical protein